MTAPVHLSSRSIPRIAFLRMASHPIPNRLLPPHLEGAFPGYRVDVFDLGAQVRAEPLTWLLNPLFMLWEHGANLFTRRITPRQAFFTTSFLFRRMSRAGRRFVEQGRYAFSFQIQSLFDARSDSTPHFVYTDHTHLTNLDYADFDRRTLRGPRWQGLERALYQDSEIVFTRSENVSRSLRERYDISAEQVVCVGAGSNARLPEGATSTSTSDTNTPANANGSGDEVAILFVGVDWPRKGGPELVEAFRRVHARHPEARLRIVGASPDIAESGVEVIGRCPLEQVHTHYADAAIFCLPSRREPFGVAYVEAMHHGLPVIGTRIGAVPEIVEEGVEGFLVDVGDTRALADRLNRLVGDRTLREQMGQRSQDRARERYTWEAVAGRMATSIQSVLPRGDVSHAASSASATKRDRGQATSIALARATHEGIATKTESVTS